MVRAMLAESLKAVISQILLPKEGGGRAAAHEIMICNARIVTKFEKIKLHK